MLVLSKFYSLLMDKQQSCDLAFFVNGAKVAITVDFLYQLTYFTEGLLNM
jgi:hypothetical protein